MAFDGLEQLKIQFDPQKLQPSLTQLFNRERRKFEVLKNSIFLILKAYLKYNGGIEIEKEKKEESKYNIVKTFKCCINSHGTLMHGTLLICLCCIVVVLKTSQH